MTKKQVQLIVNEFEEHGFEVFSISGEIHCKRVLTELTVHVRNENRTYVSLNEAADELVMISNETGFFILPIKETSVSDPKTFQFAAVRMIKRSHMEDVMKRHADYLKQLQGNYWVVQNEPKAMDWFLRMVDWGRAYQGIYADVKHVCGTYQIRKWDLLGELLLEIEATDKKLDELDAQMSSSGYFTRDESSLRVLYSA